MNAAAHINALMYTDWIKYENHLCGTAVQILARTCIRVIRQVWKKNEYLWYSAQFVHIEGCNEYDQFLHLEMRSI